MCSRMTPSVTRYTASDDTTVHSNVGHEQRALCSVVCEELVRVLITVCMHTPSAYPALDVALDRALNEPSNAILANAHTHPLSISIVSDSLQCADAFGLHGPVLGSVFRQMVQRVSVTYRAVYGAILETKALNTRLSMHNHIVPVLQRARLMDTHIVPTPITPSGFIASHAFQLP
jgi:hypothetical protein